MTTVYRGAEDRSDFAVFDARDVAKGPVGTAAIPAPVCHSASTATGRPPRRCELMDTLKYFLMAMRPLVGDLLSTIVFGILYAVTGNLALRHRARHRGGHRTDHVPQAARQTGLRHAVDELGAGDRAGAVRAFSQATSISRCSRPSISSFAVAGVMLVPGWQTRYMPQIVRDNLSPSALTFWGYAWSALIFSLGVANLYIALTMSTDAWVWFNSVVPLSAQFHPVLHPVQHHPGRGAAADPGRAGGRGTRRSDRAGPGALGQKRHRALYRDFPPLF